MEERLTIRNAALVGFVLGTVVLGALALSLRYDLRYGRCSVCSRWGPFRRQHASIREGYKCTYCSASLRYRHQASIIVAKYTTKRSKSFAELAREPYFVGLSIYEPGIIGPFRRYLEAHPNYTTSYLWEGVEPGASHKGVRCENLESLTFANDTFDLVISSDIFEHVRKPYLAFAEIHRVLKPRGMAHIHRASVLAAEAAYGAQGRHEGRRRCFVTSRDLPWFSDRSEGEPGIY